MKSMMRSMIIITLSNIVMIKDKNIQNTRTTKTKKMINMNVATNKITEKEVLTIFIEIFILIGFNFEAFND